MIRKPPRCVVILFCLHLLLLSLWGCGLSVENTETEPVTITVAYTGVESVRDYLMYLREMFPNIHIEMMSNESTVATLEKTDGLLDYMAEHLAVADITISNALDKDLPRLTEAFADLSGKDYSANYQTSYLNDVAIDGSVYYFPFYLTVKGLICNKTLFEEKGWELPNSYEEFAELLEIISQDPDGIIPIYDEDAVNTVPYWMSVYYALNEGAVLSGYQALQDLTDTMDASQMELANTLSYMSLLAKTGCLLEEELNVRELTDAEELEAAFKKGFYALGGRGTAMAFGSGMTWTVLKNRGFTDEFVVLPIYSPNCPEGYVLEQQSLNIGISKKAMEDTRKEAVIDELMRYITSEAGQQKLLEYSSGIKSPCYGIMDVESRKFMEEILSTLQNGYIVQAVDFPPLDDSFDEVIAEYLFYNEDGHLDERQVLTALEEAVIMRHETTTEEEIPVAAVSQDFTDIQTMYLLLTAMADEAGVNFAVLPKVQENTYYGVSNRSKVFRYKLLSGELNEKDIHALIVWNTPLQIYEITGTQLLQMMDYNTSILMIYGAQMEYTYDQEGDTYRTTGALLPDNSRVDPAGTYTLVTSEAVSNLNGLKPIEIKEDCLLSDAMIAYCRKQENIFPPEVPEPKYIEK